MRRVHKLALSASLFCGIAAGAEVGTTAGVFEVSPTGSAKYSIPISVPPGIGGMAPTLSIEYDSSSGDGNLGRSFTVGGLSQIVRCNRTKADDGYAKGIEFKDTDAFCLDGQRLVAVSGANGGVGTEYRTKIDGFSQIVSYGGTSGDPSYWQIRTKAGLLLEYGRGSTSRIIAKSYPPTSATALLWTLNRSVDTVGNEITYSY